MEAFAPVDVNTENRTTTTKSWFPRKLQVPESQDRELYLYLVNNEDDNHKGVLPHQNTPRMDQEWMLEIFCSQSQSFLKD